MVWREEWFTRCLYEVWGARVRCAEVKSYLSVRFDGEKACLYGVVRRSTCMVWYDACGEEGYCIVL